MKKTCQDFKGFFEKVIQMSSEIKLSGMSTEDGSNKLWQYIESISKNYNYSLQVFCLKCNWKGDVTDCDTDISMQWQIGCPKCKSNIKIDVDTKEIVQLIKDIFLYNICPDRTIEDKKYIYINNYQLSSIEKLVSHFIMLTKAKKPWFQLSSNENNDVKMLNSIVKQIEQDIIEQDMRYGIYGKEPKNDFERGVFAAIGLIQHRVHSICDI